MAGSTHLSLGKLCLVSAAALMLTAMPSASGRTMAAEPGHGTQLAQGDAGREAGNMQPNRKLALARVMTIISQAAKRQGMRELATTAVKLGERVLALPADTKDPSKRDIQEAAEIARAVLLKQRFVLDGCHAGVLFGDVGYEELDSPELAARKLLELVDLAVAEDAGFTVEIGMSTLEEMARLMPALPARLKAAMPPARRVEFVNGTYSQPYPMIIGWESNIRQFEMGLAAAHGVLGARPTVYVAQEFGHHPQIPQILQGFGYKAASLRVRLCGEVPAAKEPYVDWVGDDGTSVPCLTTLEGVPTGDETSGRLYTKLGEALGALEGSASAFGVFNNLEDVVYPVDGRAEVLACPERDKILGEFLNYSEVLARLSSQPRPRASFPRTGFRVRQFDVPEMFSATKRAEARLVTAEALDALSAVFGYESGLGDGLRGAWRELLMAENHDSFAVPDHTPGTYTVERSAIFGDYSGIRSDVTLEQKGVALAQSAARTADAAIDRLKAALGSALAASVLGGRSDCAECLEGGYHRIVLLDVSGMGGKTVATGRINFPTRETRGFSVRGPDGKAACQVLSEERWPDGTLKHVDLAVQADLPKLGPAVFLVDKAASTPKPAGSMVSKGRDGRITLDSGKVRADVSRDGRVVVASSGSATPSDGLQIWGIPCERVEVVRDGPVLAWVRFVNAGGQGVVSLVAMKDEGFIEMRQESDAAIKYQFQPRSGIRSVAYDYPFGMTQAEQGPMHALSLVVVDCEAGSFYVAQQGEPYFEFWKPDGVLNYPVREAGARVRVGVLAPGENPLGASRRMMLPAVFIEPPALDRGRTADAADLAGSAEGGVVRFDGDVLVSSVRRVGSSLEIRVLNPNEEVAKFTISRLSGFGPWRAVRLDGTDVEKPRSADVASYQLPPRRLLTLRCARAKTWS